MTAADFAAALGRRIHAARMAAGMSQSALADRLDVHTQTVSTWERGLRVPPTQQLARIAAACRTTVGALVPD